MIQLTVPFARGVALSCIEDGSVAFRRVAGFKPTLDVSKTTKVKGDFYVDAVVLYDILAFEEVELEYNRAYNYKELPLLKEYLVQQQLVYPLQESSEQGV